MPYYSKPHYLAEILERTAAYSPIPDRYLVWDILQGSR